MRKTLEVLSAALLAALIVVVGWFLFGPSPLPDRIATHFDFAGHPTQWGPSLWLLILPAVGVCNYFLLSFVARRPATFNYPVEVTPQNRPQLEALSLDLLAWLKAEISGLFLAIAVNSLRVARHPGREAAPFLVWLVLGIVFFTLGWYLRLMFRVRPQAA